MPGKLQFFMMGWKYLSKVSSRRLLWRNTIQLFHRQENQNFTGPFKVAGFSYQVERSLLTKKGEERKPDIIASSKDGWLILELSNSQNSKGSKLSSYNAIDSRYLSDYGLQVHESEPDLMTSRLELVDDGSFCQISVEDFFDVKNEQYLDNQILRSELIKAKGTNLAKLPEIPIGLVPEMKKLEIRRGIVEIILQIFEPNSSGKTLIQIVDDGLERLYDKVGVAQKKSLMDKVKNEMDILTATYLHDYLEFKDGTYVATKKFKQHHKTMELVATKLKDWAYPGAQKTFDDFSKPPFDR